jgi:short-subunit dehydrogenase
LKKSDFSKIINISSTAGLEGKSKQSAYCATKHGLLGFFRSLSIELKKDNIYIHNLCTGGLDTEFTKGFDIFDSLSDQKLLDVKKISDIIMFLLSQPENIDISEIIINRYKKN